MALTREDVIEYQWTDHAITGWVRDVITYTEDVPDGSRLVATETVELLTPDGHEARIADVRRAAPKPVEDAGRTPLTTEQTPRDLTPAEVADLPDGAIVEVDTMMKHSGFRAPIRHHGGYVRVETPGMDGHYYLTNTERISRERFYYGIKAVRLMNAPAPVPERHVVIRVDDLDLDLLGDVVVKLRTRVKAALRDAARSEP